jgi:RimJ/RimL family protein N-acetyltransferase
VLVAADNQPANRLYKKCGFEYARRIRNHNIVSNIYVADLERYKRRSKSAPGVKAEEKCGTSE